MSKKVFLIIMDGWGLGKIPASDAIKAAHTPFTDGLYHQYPHTTLITCGEEVGLPPGQMGNSEVGHLNIGAGRIVYQELQRINVAIKTGELAANQQLQATFQYAKTHNKKLHLLGLVSDGGVHSHTSHLKAICDAASNAGLERVLIHAFTDGRDTDPKSGLNYLKDLETYLQSSSAQIATITGRYYAMDRDKRWERVQLAYHALVNGKGTLTNHLLQTVEERYAAGETDEFITPIIHMGVDGRIEENDAVICFNFRTDRCREITQVLTQQNFPEFKMQCLNLHFTTMTEYDKTYKNVQVIFNNDNLHQTLGEVIAAEGLQQIRAAETEKYPHVTFFFSGGREMLFAGEKRIMAPSPKVATYDLQPTMSAYELTVKLLPELEKQTASFICLNFANTDMVGHTGVFEAAKLAAETVDTCVERLTITALQNGYTVFLTADHGNSDFMINEDGTPNTAHTLNPVPLFIIDRHWKGTILPGKLGDIAPTILSFMELPIPLEMTGNVLAKP
jgi:2,3-bisphosphoglycerate-independent phosphoglycerate mutase